MSFDQDGDAGTAVAMEDALAQVAEGDTQAVIDMFKNAPPGPVETQWGVGFRTYEECLEYIRANNMEGPGRRSGASPALHCPRTAVLHRRPLQRTLARPCARGRGHGVPKV